MLNKLRKFSDKLHEISNSNFEYNSVLELLSLENQAYNARKELIDITFETIISLPKEGKRELIVYVINHLKYETHVSSGIPWWATLTYSKWRTWQIYGEYDLSIYLGINQEQTRELLNDLAKLCSEKSYYGDVPWNEVYETLDSLSGYSYDTLDSDDIEKFKSSEIDEDIFNWCAHDIAARSLNITILELSKIYSHFSYGIFYDGPISPNAKFHDYLLMLCKNITRSQFPENMDEKTKGFLEAIKEIAVFRQQDIDTWFNKIEGNDISISDKQILTKPPLMWQGKGTELLDLFVTLQEKGFITLPNSNNAPGPTWEAVCRAICTLFDLSNFRRSDSKTEPWQTLETYFKSRSYDKITGHELYDKLNYSKRKFMDINSSNQEEGNTI